MTHDVCSQFLTSAKQRISYPVHIQCGMVFSNPCIPILSLPASQILLFQTYLSQWKSVLWWLNHVCKALDSYWISYCNVSLQLFKFLFSLIIPQLIKLNVKFMKENSKHFRMIISNLIVNKLFLLTERRLGTFQYRKYFCLTQVHVKMHFTKSRWCSF